MSGSAGYNIRAHSTGAVQAPPTCPGRDWVTSVRGVEGGGPTARGARRSNGWSALGGDNGVRKQVSRMGCITISSRYTSQ